MHVWLIRHGESEWNASGQIQGHSQVGLSQLGHLQAQHLALSLQSAGIQRIVSSDLQRARQTAEYLGQETGIDVEPTEILRERNMGVYEGGPVEAYRTDLHQHRERYGLESGYDIPSGESHEKILERATKVKNLLDGRNTALVSHGGFLSLLTTILLNEPFARSVQYQLKNTSYHLLEFNEGEFTLKRAHVMDHLGALVE